MISRWCFYIRLGWLDLLRLWSTTQHHVIIVAGICLPILMLLGLKRGHVAELRQELVTSPSGREVTFWSAQKGELMDRHAITRLERELPAVEVIIPEKQRVVRLRRRVSKTDSIEIEAATLFSTRPGDPKLKQLGIEAPRQGERALILGRSLAEQLQVGVDGRVQMEVTRGRDAAAEVALLDCRVHAVIPTETEGAVIGYADLDVLDALEHYVRGQRVPEFGWPSARQPARDGYTSYLIFCEASHDLTAEDRALFAERGLQLEDCSANPPDPLSELLDAQRRDKLKIYQARGAVVRETSSAFLYLAPSELSEATGADDVVIPWNAPARATLKNQKWVLVGLSLPKRTWLREYFREPALAFDYEALPDVVRLTSSMSVQPPAVFKWPLKNQPAVNLKLDRAIAVPSASARLKPSSLQIAAVPATLTAWLAAYQAGTVDFDSAAQLFIPLPQPAVYDRARLYSSTIDDVPAVVKRLTASHFAVMSETGRISEIQQQDRSLQLLVLVVGAGVFLFGVVTVVSVLIDSTDRKRGTIGILRVMGMSPFGIFSSILMRATAIGGLSAGLSMACGWAIAHGLQWVPPAPVWWLMWKPVMHVEILPVDWGVVALGSFVCCGVGALLPAWRASRLDPFDAIVEGRFH